MKNIIVLVLLVISSLQIFAQSSEPEPILFRWGASQTPRQFEIDSFPQTKFLTGFQWSGTGKIDFIGNKSQNILAINL